MTSEIKHPLTHVWVLFRTDGGETVLCGTAYTRDDAGRWSESGKLRGAIRLPLNDMAGDEDRTWR